MHDMCCCRIVRGVMDMCNLKPKYYGGVKGRYMSPKWEGTYVEEEGK